MILVAGCGFCGANAILRVLRDDGYFIGRYFLQPNKTQHPYEVNEDADIYCLQEQWIKSDIRGKAYAKRELIELLEKRKQSLKLTKHKDLAFKTPNNWQCLSFYEGLYDRIIAGARDSETLISRMQERWGYTESQAFRRITQYSIILGKITVPLLIIQQETLLTNSEEQNRKILEFANEVL